MNHRVIVQTALVTVLLPLLVCCGSGRQDPPRESAASSPKVSIGRPRNQPYVRVLGTVQDGGLPHAACTCDRCETARQDPAARRFVASIALILPSTDEVFLFDATPDLHQQLYLLRDVRDPPIGRVDRAPVDGVFLTHAHIGHYLGLAFFGYEVVSTSQLQVFATPKMSDFLRQNGPWSQLVDMQNVRLDEIEPGSARGLADSVTVEAFLAPHRDEYADTLGFVLRGPNKSLLYLPDTDSWAAWQYPVDEFINEVDFALIDGTFYSSDEMPGRPVEEIGHPLISTSMDLFQKLVDTSTTEIYFTHLNHTNEALEPNSEASREIRARGFRILQEGDQFDL